MNISTTALKVGDLLRDNRIYVVPLFQRSYAWESEQITDFWMDLIDTAKQNEDYFIGSMVFTPHEERNKVKILDGQQRLATFLLFLAALRDVLKHAAVEGSADWIDDIDRIIYTRDVPTRSKNPKLELNKEDKTFFEKITIEGNIPDIRYKSHKCLTYAYVFFKEKINKEVEKNAGRFVEDILDALLNRFILIKIEVDNDVNAHMIFETLNDRGLELTVADLVKNYIFSVSGSKYVEEVVQMWKEMVDQVEDRNVTRFLRHFWLSHYRLVKKEEIYKELKSKVNSSNVKKFMEMVSNEAIVYANLRNPSHEFWGDNDIEKLLKELNILKVEQVYVLLLSLYNVFYHKRKEVRLFKKLLQLLINFTFRYNTVCSLNPNELERLYSNLAIKLRKNEIEERDIKREIEKLSPSEETFLDSFRALEVKNGKLAKYILLKINNHLLIKRGEKEVTTNIDKTNLEHIIPKKPDKEWKEFFKKNQIDFETLVHRLGNMTILLKEFNRKIANKFFDKKKAMYQKSKLPLNESLVTFNKFGEEEIERRQEEMGRIANEIWSI